MRFVYEAKQINNHASSVTLMPSTVASTTPQNITEVLRLATQTQHNNLHHHPLHAITHPDYNLVNYLSLLNAYYCIYSALEQVIQDYLATTNCEFNYTPRLKTAKLLKDIAYFKQTLPTQPLCKPPGVNDIASLIGILYVIEGASLGGQLLCRSLAKQYALNAEQGCCFFTGYANLTASHWREFQAFANRNIDLNTAEQSIAQNTAQQTFWFFKQILDELQERLYLKQIE